MRAIFAFAFSLALGSPGFAATYGTADGGCEQAAGNPVSDTAIFYDGARIAGQDWGCNLTPKGDKFLGACNGEGGDEDVMVIFAITTDGDTVTISSDVDDGVYTLKRCD